MKLFPFFDREANKSGYRCGCCGKFYNELPLCFGSDYPDYYFSVPPNERAQRVQLRESLCVVDGQLFFHRGRLTIPIIDYHEDLIFNVWTSISPENFGLRMDLWEDPARVNQEPHFGWLQTVVATYSNTLNLQTIAVEQPVGFIPEIKLIAEGHPLTNDQANGITYKQAVSIVDKIMAEQHR